MTLKARVIPCLNVKDGRVVNFVDLVDAGDPVEAAMADRSFVAGAIYGRALHDGAIDLAEAPAALAS